MKTRFSVLVSGLCLLVCGSAAVCGGEAFPAFPGEEARYFYRAELNQVLDGRTVALDLDLGFFVWLHKTPIRLLGLSVADKTTEEGVRAMEWLTGQLRDATELGELRVKTYPAPPGSDVPWLGVLYVNGKNLNQEMVTRGLARQAAAQP